MSYTTTSTHSYSVADVQTVMKLFSADIIMIAQSTGAMTEMEARKYVHDVTEFATRDYLSAIDVTLLSGTVEVRATRYDVRAGVGGLATGRPGGVLWPRVPLPSLRIVVQHDASYDAAAQAALSGRLKFSWGSTTIDFGHSALSAKGGRSYASNGWGVERKDYAA